MWVVRMYSLILLGSGPIYIPSYGVLVCDMVEGPKM